MAKSRGPDLPTLGSSSWTIPRATEAIKPGTPRRARISRKTIVQGMPDRFGVPVVTCLRAFFIARKAAGAFVAPAFPAPSFPKGATTMQSSGISCRENAESHPLRCHARSSRTMTSRCCLKFEFESVLRAALPHTTPETSRPFFVELAFNELRDRNNRLLGVGAERGDGDGGAGSGGEHHQAHDRSAADGLCAARDPDL